jgi:hypothetical protein
MRLTKEPLTQKLKEHFSRRSFLYATATMQPKQGEVFSKF